jgi:hypothetical protein
MFGYRGDSPVDQYKYITRFGLFIGMAIVQEGKFTHLPSSHISSLKPGDPRDGAPIPDKLAEVLERMR